MREGSIYKPQDIGAKHCKPLNPRMYISSSVMDILSSGHAIGQAAGEFES